MRYPLRYEEEITVSAKENELSPSLLMAVICVESGFNERAVSNKGAVGLMQLMPKTASWCAKRLGIDYELEMLKNAEYNIALGAHYLRYLLDKFGSEKIALAAYNAGEGNVMRWKEAGLTEIPFTETADYISKVSFAKAIYEKRMKQPSP